MNKYFYQFTANDDQIYEFTKLVPDPDIENGYLRIDKHSDSGTTYESYVELERTFDGDFNSFKLELVYE